VEQKERQVDERARAPINQLEQVFLETRESGKADTDAYDLAKDFRHNLRI
jgi:hypothetical protein